MTVALTASILLCLPSVAAADEGMWLSNFLPTAKLKPSMDSRLTKVWRGQVQLSLVRFDNGGCESFVSTVLARICGFTMAKQRPN
jgi:hypothetical protein